MNKENVFIYGTIIIIFVVSIGLFVLCAALLLPARVASLVVGLAGFTVLVVGPFWAMMLEKRLRDRFEKTRKDHE